MDNLAIKVGLIPLAMLIGEAVLPEVVHQGKRLQPLWMAYFVLSYALAFRLVVTQDLGDLLIIGTARFLIGFFRIPGWWARLINWEWKKPQPVCDRKYMFLAGLAMQGAVNYFAVLY